MKSKFAAMMLVTMVLAVAFAIARMQHGDAGTVKVPPGEEPKSINQELPPLPAGVTELKFSEFFVTPIGDRGLTVTEKLRSLDGKRVRMLGFMVRQEDALPGKFLFTAIPVQLADHDAALADDLPPATVYVTVPTCRDRQIPYAPGPMLLTGTLSVGNREEEDGRISIVRLALDPPTRGETKAPLASGKAAELVRSFHSAAR
jgi:hypothetical protein